MYTLKTLTQALLVVSIATSSLATISPDRDGTHEARAALKLPAGLVHNVVNAIKTAGAKVLSKTTVAEAKNRIVNVTTTPDDVDMQDIDARAAPLKISPEIVNFIKTTAVGGLVGGAASATINGVINLFKDKDGTQQARGLGALSDDDLRLLSILSRRVIEELD